MITHVHSTTVVVSNQDAAIEFYTKTLEWEKTADMPMGPEMRWVTVAPKGATTQFALAVPGWFKARPAGGETGISLIAKDIDETVATLTSRGVRFKSPVEMMPWGKKATWFFDPDGNEFFLAEE